MQPSLWHRQHTIVDDASGTVTIAFIRRSEIWFSAFVSVTEKLKVRGLGEVTVHSLYGSVAISEDGRQTTVCVLFSLVGRSVGDA